MSLWTRAVGRSAAAASPASLTSAMARLSVASFSSTAAASEAAPPADKAQAPAKRHGLLDFFQDGVSLPKDAPRTGRAWRASELRQKSFDDLHKLWYVLLKERNVLASQREEARRFSITSQFFSNYSREIKCRKSMARIKSVLSERQIAYERAVKRHRREQYVERRNKMYAEIAAATEAKKAAAAAAGSAPAKAESKAEAKRV
ncbi:mitochondrial 39-S ribosomal protein L47 (MRP-L47)-domain-containing protein [Thamnocephalis sphaerospora]|uniref:Large ribosomal subunit protein uL29m n=1 Tax=Thamnocephalis sphaerospora TaxID=78915 RepID=A0A4P9XYD4_9FUNG|nr:mitochondrial 39-S ribosomal protein L47 (MRP-L47)-domain-containing protein [Thamnocephalis sphaerospora]|eukprot:RKP11122.1 mitochondrial 39-S ribosomal protein L47 (MRP-L47)-domain-containing protein [Thamnocephalis sphaerospora]